MTYKYEDERANLFTEDGQVLFLAVRDAANQLLTIAGAFKADRALDAAVKKLGVATNWGAYAVLDRMVELDELKEVTAKEKYFPGDRVFVKRNREA